MNSLSFFLLLLLTLFDICWAQHYYCIPGLGGDQLRCGPKAQNTAGQTLDPYPSINLCCSDQRDDIDPLLLSRIQTFDTKPPAALPTDCVPSIRKITLKFDCFPDKQNAFIHWHPYVGTRTDRAICCKGTPTNEPDVYDDTLAIQVPPGEVEIVFLPGQTPGPTPNPNPIPGPIPPIQATTRRPMRPIVPFRPSRISAFCRDLTIPGRPFDCAANADRCTDPLYINLMAQQCPATCNLCGRLRQQNPLGGGGGVIDRHIGGGRGCRDWIPPSGHMSCQQMVANLYCQNHRTQMVAQCPVSCGFCTPSFGMK